MWIFIEPCRDLDYFRFFHLRETLAGFSRCYVVGYVACSFCISHELRDVYADHMSVDAQHEILAGSLLETCAREAMFWQTGRSGCTRVGSFMNFGVELCARMNAMATVFGAIHSLC